jgi:hypothetical protein
MQHNIQIREKRSGHDPGKESGSILILTMNVILVMTTLAGAFLLTAMGTNQEQTASVEGLRAFYLAETGLNAAFADIAIGGQGKLGSESSPFEFDGGSYWVDAVELPGRRLIVATGLFQGQRRSLEAVADSSGKNQGFFKDGLTASGDINVYGQSLVDGYDSRLGLYNGQALTLTPSGRLRANPTGSLSSAGTATIGDFAEILGNVTGSSVVLNMGAYVFGSTFPSVVSTDFPPVIPPVIPGPSLNSTIPTGRIKISKGEYN